MNNSDTLNNILPENNIIDKGNHSFDLDDEDTMDFEPSPIKKCVKTTPSPDLILDCVLPSSPQQNLHDKSIINTFYDPMRQVLAESIKLGRYLFEVVALLIPLT